MIIKISKANMQGNYLPNADLPEGFEFFASHTSGDDVFCYVTDGMENEINVPFQAATINDLASATPIVGESLLSDYGLPHGQSNGN